MNSTLNNDKNYIEHCFELARKGAGMVSPNPLVGCVIVKNGKVISEGWHKKYGASHGERDAIDKALKKGISIKGAELYVNLEPCAHYGLTPPCSDYIIEHKLAKVIIGCRDPYYKVSGKGIKKLKAAGINVVTGVLEKEAKELNKFFIKYVTTGLPYIMLKAAQTADGKIADEKYRSKWISCETSRKTVHKMRAVYDAVLVGANTVRYDNPLLTVRSVKGRNPYRILIDKDLALNLHYKIFNLNDSKTIVIASEKAKPDKIKKFEAKGIKIILCRIKGSKVDLLDAMQKIAEMKVTSIMTEGGAFVYNEFLKYDLADEVNIFTAPKVMGKGIKGFNERKLFERFKDVSYSSSGTDMLVNLRR